MCQVSLIGFAVGGAFLSLAYFDLPYNILVIVVALSGLRVRGLVETQGVRAEPAGRPNGVDAEDARRRRRRTFGAAFESRSRR
jgi:hypothetical protein